MFYLREKSTTDTTVKETEEECRPVNQDENRFKIDEIFFTIYGCVFVSFISYTYIWLCS